jgi:hypothetical protein
MSDRVPFDRAKPAETLQRASRLIEQVTAQLPISQTVVPLADTFDWLLDDVSTEEQWEEARKAFERKFAQRWHIVSGHALSQDPRKVSARVLTNADYDPFRGAQPWGVELTHTFRAALAEIGPVATEATRVLPVDKRMRAFARGMNTQTGRRVLPLISYAPLVESEWQAIIEKLDEIVELTLAFEGALVVWLIGGFARDVEGMVQLRPQLSIPPPTSGTRVKPLHVLLGTAYEEQCPTLISLAQAAYGTEIRPSDSLIKETPWHRVVVQFDVTVDDYELLNLNRLSDADRQIARQVMYLDREARGQHVLEGIVHDVPRPWKRRESVPQAPPPPPPASKTRVLPPLSALQAASQPSAPAASQPANAERLRQDAEEMRRKGMATIATNPAIAQKYLLASTVLDNTSVDVWLTLVDLATSEKQRESFRREAAKVLRRQHRNG